MTDNHVAPLNLYPIMRSKATSLGWQAHPQGHQDRKRRWRWRDEEAQHKTTSTNLTSLNFIKTSDLSNNIIIVILGSHKPRSKKYVFEKSCKKQIIMIWNTFWISNRRLRADKTIIACTRKKYASDKAV